MFIAFVWLANGLICKVLNLVPRHEAIVARILGYDFSRQITLLIGLAEIGMAVWVLSRYQSKWCAISQMLLVAVMNLIEALIASDLLLWGHFNGLFALLFIGLIYYTEFVSGKKQRKTIVHV